MSAHCRLCGYEQQAWDDAAQGVLCGGHIAWFHFDPRDPDSRLPTHKHCRRCFRNELNL